MVKGKIINHKIHNNNSINNNLFEVVYLVALLIDGSIRITVARFTASATGKVPIVRLALVTLPAHNMRQTPALPCITSIHALGPRAQDVAHANYK